MIIRINRGARHSFWASERYRYRRHSLLIVGGAFLFIAVFMALDILVG